MGLQELAIWYQRKIGTYDKQLWERTVEQRILHGLTHVPRKSAKLKTELIDVDLVRGSSFPKAKPKHGLITVARLGVQRLLLLPLYWQWWVQQTSPRAYIVLLVLYLMQAFNVGLYFHYSQYHIEDLSDSVSACEVLVPMFMMIVLSIIHSQIVCTHNGQPPELQERSRRRIKRTKRRPLLPCRIRVLNSETKSSPSEAEKHTASNEVNGKFNKRVNLRRKTDDSSKRCKLSDSEEKLEVTPRIRVCFKEPEDEEESVKHEPTNNQAGREGTPLDDDGFESLNGNGSSENGDEPVDDDLESTHTPDINKNSKKYSEIFLKCPDNCRLDTDTKQDADNVENTCNNTCCETVICDDSVPNIDLFDPYKDKHSNFRIIENPKKEENSLGSKSPSSSKIDAGINNDNKTSSDWLSGETCKDPIRESDGGWSCEEVDHIMNRNHIIQRRQSVPLPRTHLTNHDTDSDGLTANKKNDTLLKRRRGSQNLLLKCPTVTAEESSYNSSCCDESEDGGNERLSSPCTGGSGCENQNLTEGGTTSATDYMGVTTNSEECSYSSDMDESDSHMAPVELNDHPFAWEFEQSPAVILSPSCAASDKVSCTMWESRDVKKADLSVLDISSAIIARVESMPESMDYFYMGMVLALLLSMVPPFCRLLLSSAVDVSLPTLYPAVTNSTLPLLTWQTTHLLEYLSEWSSILINGAFGSYSCERTIMIIALLERFVLAELFFFLLAVAERSFKQRFFYAKLFSHLTSFRRARKSELPHFRLNKVRNIKTWLSVRSYLRKRGPQRSVDMLVSAAFIICLLLLTFLIVELLKDSVRLNSQYNMEALCWCLCLGLFLMRFMTLGTDINRKYCNLSVLITEQINLYLQIEQKPHKKEALMVANSVLKLAADLLKELESPFKISGLSANPYLYNITNVVILSALSGVLSEILGFKLKLHKIKIK